MLLLITILSFIGSVLIYVTTCSKIGKDKITTKQRLATAIAIVVFNLIMWKI